MRQLLIWLGLAVLAVAPSYYCLMGKRSQLRLACMTVPKEVSVEKIIAYAESKGLQAFVERDMKVRLTVPGGSLHFPNCTVFFDVSLKSSRAQYFTD